MIRPSPKLAWLLLALMLLAVFFVLVDERCSWNEDKWQRGFGVSLSEKLSKGD